MKKIFILTCLTMAIFLLAAPAMADSIKGRLGVAGRIGFIVPADNSIGPSNVSTDLGFIGGGGVIYGLTNNVALELDITHATYSSSPGIDFNTTNVSLGAQYRFLNVPVKHLVPYVGGGVDILINGIDSGLDVDTVAGVSVKGGVDYFITKEFAATVEMKGILAPDADIHNFNGVKIGNFDPMSFSMTFGVRYFFNL